MSVFTDQSINAFGNIDLYVNVMCYVFLCTQRGGHVVSLQTETPVTPLTSIMPGKKNLPKKTGRKRKSCQLEVCVFVMFLFACKTSIWSLVPHTGASYMHSPIQLCSKFKFCNGRNGMQLPFLDGFFFQGPAPA